MRRWLRASKLSEFRRGTCGAKTFFHETKHGPIPGDGFRLSDLATVRGMLARN